MNAVRRFLLFPETFKPMLRHPVQSMFIGCIPMAMATIVNGLPTFLLQYWCAAALVLGRGWEVRHGKLGSDRRQLLLCALQDTLCPAPNGS